MPFDEQQIMQTLQQTKLTAELATSNPELFKAKLLFELGKNNFGEGTKKNWSAMRKRLNKTGDDLVLNTENWLSNTSADGIITLGVGVMDEGIKKDLLFEDQNFSESSELLYRFSHEVAHVVAWYGTNQRDDLTNLFLSDKAQRERKKGFSPLGSLDFYKQRGSDVQAKEDIVELINMYSWSPDYFRRYLNFLNDPNFREVRTRLKLVTLSQSAIGSIYKIIEASTLEFQNV